ncbi:MAG: hypothetical protein ABJN72_00750 [Sulfitobacter sp.]
MLDRQMEQVERPKAKGILHGKRIIVLGACCGFGRSMARAMMGCGAQVVVADAAGEGLERIGKAVPLALKGEPEDALRRVGRAWGEARLDAVVNLMPLRQPGRIDLNVAVLQAAVQAFMPALTASDGQIVTVARRPEQALGVQAGAMVPALLSAQGAFVDALRRDGLALNLVNMGTRADAAARPAVIGLLARSMGPLNGTELRL